MVEFRPVTRQNFEQVIDIRVAAHQVDFVDSVVYSLAQAYVLGESCKPFAIYHNDEVIGFIMFRYALNRKRTEVASLIISKKHQNKGYGTKAFELAMQFLKDEGKTEVVQLDYNPADVVAKRIYERHGFAPVRREDCGEIMMERELFTYTGG